MGRGRVRFAICSSCAFLLRHPPFGLQCRVRPLHVRIGFISTRFRTHACASQCADVFRLPSKVLPCGMPVQLMVRTLQMAAAKMKAWTGVSGGVHGHCPCEVTLALIDTCLFGHIRAPALRRNQLKILDCHRRHILHPYAELSHHWCMLSTACHLATCKVRPCSKFPRCLW